MILNLPEMRIDWKEIGLTSDVYELSEGHLAIDILDFGPDGWTNPHDAAHVITPYPERLTNKIPRTEFLTDPPATDSSIRVYFPTFSPSPDVGSSCMPLARESHGQLERNPSSESDSTSLAGAARGQVESLCSQVASCSSELCIQKGFAGDSGRRCLSQNFPDDRPGREPPKFPQSGI